MGLQISSSSVVNSPLEGQVKVNEKNAKGVADLIGRTGKLGSHRSQA